MNQTGNFTKISTDDFVNKILEKNHKKKLIFSQILKFLYIMLLEEKKMKSTEIHWEETLSTQRDGWKIKSKGNIKKSINKIKIIL